MTQIPDDLLDQLNAAVTQGNDMVLEAAAQEIRDLRKTVKQLWLGTVWGAGKVAVFEGHKAVLLRAGIPGIRD